MRLSKLLLTRKKDKGKDMTKSYGVKIDENGNKVVEPVYWGAGGCVGGDAGIKR